MKTFAIVTDSSCDLNSEFRQKNNIEYAKMIINWRDENDVLHEDIADIDWKVISAKGLYDSIRAGRRITTSQVTTQNYQELFEANLKKGIDVLYLACSSALSASLRRAEALWDNELKAKYPNNKVIILDTLRAGMAQGLIVMRAVELRDQGKSLEEVAEIIEQEKRHYKEVGIPETLTYLRKAGRVSAPAAYFGNMIGLKPILMFDDRGYNEAKEKTFGKKKAFARMAEIIRDDIVDPENQEIYLMNADCSELDVNNFKKEILDRVKVKNIIVEQLGPVIGATAGPGTIIVNYKGK